MALQQSAYFNGVTYFRKRDSPKNCGYRWDIGGGFGSNVTLLVFFFNSCKLQEFPIKGKIFHKKTEAHFGQNWPKCAMRETKKLRACTHACLGGSICPYLDWNLNFRGADVGIIQIGPTVSKLSLETWLPMEIGNLKIPAQTRVVRVKRIFCSE